MPGSFIYSWKLPHMKLALKLSLAYFDVDLLHVGYLCFLMPLFCRKMSNIGLGSSFFEFLYPSLHRSNLIMSGSFSVFNVVCLCSHTSFYRFCVCTFSVLYRSLFCHWHLSCYPIKLSHMLYGCRCVHDIQSLERM